MSHHLLILQEQLLCNLSLGLKVNTQLLLWFVIAMSHLEILISVFGQLCYDYKGTKEPQSTVVILTKIDFLLM